MINMEIAQQIAENSNASGFCEFCYNIGTSRCGKCRSVYYCSKEHQIAHWPTHKKMCSISNPLRMAGPASQIATHSGMGFPSQNSAWSNPLSYASGSSVQVPYDPSALQDNDFTMPTDEEIFSTLDSELLSSDNNFWDIINTCDFQNLLEHPFSSATALDPDREKAVAKISENLQASAGAFCSRVVEEEDECLMRHAPVQDICSTVVHDLLAHGICVLDKFLGVRQGTLLLEEVKSLYEGGIFRKGELQTPSNAFVNNEAVRSDVTTWVSGKEAGCHNIGILIRMLDIILTTCNKSNDNGILASYKLNRRTKAMLACYPGDGTHYKRHVDNPCRDGRCITCIYYLNKEWNTERDGGVLRMFPASHESEVAHIEPIFDRLIFFWSDKRNPHEVLPAFATRFAITVWYFDADERDRALASVRDKRRL